MTPANHNNVHSPARASRARDLLGPSRSRSPEEALGAVAEGSLGSSMIYATVATLALLVVGTLGPWAIAQAFPSAEKPKAVARESTVDANEPRPSAEGSADAAATGEETSATAGTSAAPGAVELLGIGEEKKAPANKNPLEEGLDDLLKVD